MSIISSTRQWRKGQLQDLVFFQRGFDITRAQQRPGPYPVISSSGVTSFHDEFKVNGPGIVIGRKGTLGSIHFSENDYWPHDTTLWSKELKGNNARFVYYYLYTVNFKRFDVGNSNPTLNRNHIHDLPALIPPLNVQDRITDLLSTYDDLTENNLRRMTLLEESARLLYQEWFVRLRFPGHEHTRITNGIPEGWDASAVGDFVEVQSGFAFKSSTYQKSGKHGIVTIKNVQDGDFLMDCDSALDDPPEKMPVHCRLSTGDILLSLTGNIGRTCLVFGEDYLLNQRVAKLVPRVPMARAFVYFAFRNEAMRKQLESLSYGVAQQNLSPVKMSGLPFANPPINLLRQFAEFAEPIIDQLLGLKQHNQKLKQARDLLLPKLMSGEITV
jgi:type I restriction enzyme, S subunit